MLHVKSDVLDVLPSLYSESMRFLTSSRHLVSFEEVMKNASKEEKKLRLAIVRRNPISTATKE